MVLMTKSKERSSDQFNPLEFLRRHYGHEVIVHMRRDDQSGNLPDEIKGKLLYLDIHSGIAFINTDSAHNIIVNRGSMSFIEIPRGGERGKK